MRALPIPFIQSWMYSFIWPILGGGKLKKRKKANSSRKGFQTSEEKKKSSCYDKVYRALRLSVIFKRIVERLVDA